MVFGWDDAAMLALQMASAAGGIFGNKRKHIDPEMLRQKFGPNAVSKDTIELANYILNSPQGQKLLAGAAESGQQFQNNVNANAASAGLAGPGGASGTGIFSTSAGSQAQSGFERAIKGDVYNAAMPIAAEGVANRQNAYINDLQGGGYQDDKARMFEAIGKAAGSATAIGGLNKQAPAGNAATASETNLGITPADYVGGQNKAALSSTFRPKPAEAAFYDGQNPTAKMLSSRARRRNSYNVMNQRNVQPMNMQRG